MSLQQNRNFVSRHKGEPRHVVARLWKEHKATTNMNTGVGRGKGLTKYRQQLVSLQHMKAVDYQTHHPTLVTHAKNIKLAEIKREEQLIKKAHRNLQRKKKIIKKM